MITTPKTILIPFASGSNFSLWITMSYIKSGTKIFSMNVGTEKSTYSNTKNYPIKAKPISVASSKAHVRFLPNKSLNTATSSTSLPTSSSSAKPHHLFLQMPAKQHNITTQSSAINTQSPARAAQSSAVNKQTSARGTQPLTKGTQSSAINTLSHARPAQPAARATASSAINTTSFATAATPSARPAQTFAQATQSTATCKQPFTIAAQSLATNTLSSAIITLSPATPTQSTPINNTSLAIVLSVPDVPFSPSFTYN